MKRLRKSFGHALDGLTHAFSIEKNLQIFLPAYAVVLMLGLWIGLLAWEWLALILTGGFFLSIELLNTSLERLADILDDQKKVVGSRKYHSTLKASKDVAAGASLVSLTATIVVIIIVFMPYVRLFI